MAHDDILAREFEAQAATAAATLGAVRAPFARLVDLCAASVRGGGKLLFFGNGGSAADAQHLATELTVRLVREIYSAVQPEQVSDFLDLLFAVALADSHVSNGEMDEIYEMSRSLGLAHRTFIDAKLKVPAELRDA